MTSETSATPLTDNKRPSSTFASNIGAVQLSLHGRAEYTDGRYTEVVKAKQAENGDFAMLETGTYWDGDSVQAVMTTSIRGADNVNDWFKSTSFAGQMGIWY